MTVEELQVIVTARTRGLEQQMQGLTRQLRGVQRQTNTMSTNMTRTFTSLKRTLVGLGIGKAIKSMFDLSRTYEAATQQVNRIFKENASAIEAWIEKNAVTFGMARADAMQYASIYGNLVRAFEKDTAKMSEYTTQLLEATTVIASSTGRTVKDVSERIRSGILGNTEAIEDLGIYAQVAMLKTSVAFKTIANGRTWDQLTFQEQQQIRVMSILEQSATQFGTSIQQNTNYQLMQLTANLKNVALNLGNAFMPIVSVVLPVLNSMALALANVTNKIAAFMNALFGTNFNTGAGDVQQVAASTGDAVSGYEDMANAADDAGESAKKAGKAAKNAIMGFDEINSLSKNNGSDSGSGGGDNSTSDTGVTTSTVMSQAAESFADKVEGVMDRLKSLFQEGFEIGLGTGFEDRVEDIKDSIEGIKTSLKDIFTDSEVLNSASKLADAIALNLGKVTGSVVSIGTTIAQNLLGGIDKYLVQNSQYIKDRLIGIMDVSTDIVNLAGDFAVAFADIFSVFGGETAQQITANIIGMFANGFLGAIELALRFSKDLLDAITSPIIENKDLIKETLEGMLVPIETITGSLKQTVEDTFLAIQTAYTTYVEPAFENIKAGLTALVENILTNYNTHIQPVLDSLSEKFAELMQGPIQGFINTIIDNIGQIIENGSILWKDTLEPMIEGLNNTLAPALGVIVEKLGEFALLLIEKVAEGAKIVSEKLKDISDWCVEHQEVIADIVAVVTAWAAAWGLAELALVLFNAATTAWTVISTTATAATKAFSAAIAFLTSPIGLVIAAIAAVIAIVVLLVRHWDEVKEAASKCWDWIVEKWNSAGEWFNTTVVEPIKNFFGGLWEGIKTTASECWNGLVSTWQEASTWFNTTIIEPIKNFFIALWLEIQHKAEFAWTYIKGIWGVATNWFSTTIIEPIKNKFSEWSTNVKQLATDAWTGVKTAWESAKQWFSSTVIDPIATNFSKLWNGLKTSASNAFTEIGNSAKRGMNWVIDHINNMIDGINSKLSFTLPEFFGGGKVGFSIPNIPRLARGGIIDGATFMGNYIAGEAGKEMVVPLENTSFTDKIASAMGQAVMNAMSVMLNGNSGTGNTQNVVLEWDGVAFARTATPYMIKEMRRLGIEL